MKVLYLDESGDHNLVVLDADYPVFVLGGCIIDQGHHDNSLKPRLEEFKRDFLSTDEIILHYSDYTRNRNGFERMQEEAFRNRFFTDLNKVIEDTNFILVACIIDKARHREHYINARDPYLFALEVILERFVMLLNSANESGIIIAESRGTQLDNALDLAFLDLRINGTSYLTPKEIDRRVDRRFYIKKKEENIAGLQLIDSVVTPIGRRYINLPNRYLDYAIIKRKFRRAYCGRYMGYGLVILPH